MIVLPDAVAQHSTMMVETQYATLTNAAVRSPRWSPKFACAAPFTFCRLMLCDQRKGLLAYALVVAITFATVTATTVTATVIVTAADTDTGIGTLSISRAVC